MNERPIRIPRFAEHVDPLAQIERRDRVFRMARACSACGSEQVQCRDWWSTPTQWRCRMCKHEWTQEPPHA